MANALQIDTLAFSKKLREAGADEKLAEAIVEGITAADTSELATKADITNVETALKQDIANVEAALKQDIADVKSDVKWIKIIGGTILGLLILPYLGSALGLG